MYLSVGAVDCVEVTLGFEGKVLIEKGWCWGGFGWRGEGWGKVFIRMLR